MSTRPYRQPVEIHLNPRALARPLGVALLVFAVIILRASAGWK
jgi:hypothetical protein